MERAHNLFGRNIGAISPAQSKTLAGGRIAVFGLGGVGGIGAELLVRAGVGHLLVVDSDRFETTNLNRQIHSEKKTMGKKKTAVFAHKALDIHPKLDLYVVDQRLGDANLGFFASVLKKFGPDLVIDTMDSAPSRVMLARLCKKSRVPYVYAAAMGARGMVSVFSAKDNLERILHLPSFGKPDSEIESALVHYPQCQSAWGPATNLVGALAANAALNQVLKKQGSYPHAPDFWMVDAFGEKIVRTEKLS